MLVKHSMDKRFLDVMDRLRKECGEEMLELSGIGEKHLDINTYTKRFFGDNTPTSDKTIDGNANVSDVSVNAWETELKKPILKLNTLYRIWSCAEKKHGIKRANKIIEHEIKGAIRTHDAHSFEKPYCWASSLKTLVHEGMPFYDKIKIGPVKHFDSFINLSLQYICYISNQIAGAIALPDLLVYADYFIRKDYGEEWHKDEVTRARINQLFQNWIFSVNFSWRSNQSPFTNVSVFDRNWLESIFSQHYNPDYTTPNFDNVMRIQKMFTEEMLRNLKDNPFTFPVMTACLLFDDTTGTYKDQEFFDWVAGVQSESGLFNIFQDTNINALSSCCRLRNSLEISKNEYTNSFGVGGLSIGSHRVVTVNLPQVSYESESWDDFMKLLEYRINVAQDVLDINRDVLQHNIDSGKLPLYTHGYMDLNKQFSTVGFIGMYEALEEMGYDITTEVGSDKGLEIVALINTLNEKRTKKDGHIRNVEQIPGESAAANFAKKDALIYPEKTLSPLYSNQYVPLVHSVDIIERINAQGKFDGNVGGGSILHLNFDEILTKDQFKQIMEHSAAKGVMYFAVNYGLSQCKTCGKTYVGKLTKSPCHDADVDMYLRVVGFMTKVENWTSERRDEFTERQFYSSDVL